MAPFDRLTPDQRTAVVGQLVDRGWTRLESALSQQSCEALERAAPATRFPLPETEGGAGVRQAGLVCASSVA